VNPKVRDELGRIINDKLECGIIEPFKSPSSSTVLLLPKPKGGIRFVLDYPALNKYLIGDAYTLPRVEETTTALEGTKYFSTLDVKEAFYAAWPLRVHLASDGLKDSVSCAHLHLRHLCLHKDGGRACGGA
jgi:hypothetical protein